MSGQPQTTADERAAALRRELADALLADGMLSHEWHEAFSATPRHLFVPQFYANTPEGVHVVDASAGDEWLRAVYSDRLLVTREDVTSSSTAPSLMAAMLEALDLTGNERVLEIGTGTGYTAALLSQRLGDRQVVTVDIDADLVEQARQRLKATGYQPAVALGDGAAGYSAHAPYDRIIATCRVDQIPPAWLTQTTIDGVVVAPLGAGVARITNHGDGQATGRFLPNAAYFMPLRHDVGQAELADVIDAATALSGTTRIREHGIDIYRDNEARFWLDLNQPGVHTGQVDDAGIAYHADGSWARINGDTVAQGGTRRLWDEIETSHSTWLAAGKPTRDRFGLTITPEHQHVWLDDPANGPVHALPLC